jgi:outer membrane murein-binding lipoprotein Lpp
MEPAIMSAKQFLESARSGAAFATAAVALLAGCASSSPPHDPAVTEQVRALQGRIASLEERVERSELALVAVSERARRAQLLAETRRVQPGAAPGAAPAPRASPSVSAVPAPESVAVLTDNTAGGQPAVFAAPMAPIDPARFRWGLTAMPPGLPPTP